MRKPLVLDLVTLGLLLFMIAITIGAYGDLPETMPVHFDGAGNPNGWAPRAFGAWLGPVASAVMFVLLRGAGILVGDEAKRARVEMPLRGAALGMVGLFAVVQVLVLNAATSQSHQMNRVIWVPIVAMIVGVPWGLVSGMRKEE